MPQEDWIDALQDVWRTIAGNGFSAVNAPYLIKEARYPTAIVASDLSKNPMALTFPSADQYEYSLGGPQEGFYRGTTEFHVAPSIDLSLIPSLIPWKTRILRAAASHATLGGLVHSFMLEKREDQIMGPISLQYGDESEHWGFVAHWIVKENLAGRLTFATGE